MPTATTNELLSTSQAARVSGVAAETVRAWVRSGHLRAIPTPLGMLISREALAAWLAARAAALQADTATEEE